MHEVLNDFEKFINLLDAMPPSLKAAIIHAQVEKIHPLIDNVIYPIKSQFFALET
jgi:Fic family protein